MQILLKTKYFERGLSKTLEKLTLSFLSNSVPINEQRYQKHKEPGTREQSLFRLRNKFRKIPLLAIYYDQIWWCNIKQFLTYSKNHICKFMQANSWHHKLFHFHFPFWIWKLMKGRKTYIKIWIPRERKELFRCNKKDFL